MRGNPAELAERSLSSMPTRWAARALHWLSGLVVVAASPTYALSLGGERVASFLGQPLRVEIPIDVSAGENWDLSCFALVPNIRRDGAPTLRQGRLELSGDSRRLVVRTFGPIDEPAIRFAIDVGCSVPLRREFTVLLDPAPVLPATATISAPIVETPNTPVAPQSASERTAAAGSPAQSASATEKPSRASTARASKPRETAANANRAASRASNRVDATSSARRDPRLVVKGADSAVDDASLAALAVPRLRISSELSAWAVADPNNPNSKPSGGAPLDELSAAIAKERRARLAAAPIDEDLPARLEADLVVAKKRLAELQAQIAASTPTAPGDSATKASESKNSESDAKPASNKPTSVVEASDFDWRDWVWVPALAVVAGMFAFLWRQHRSRRDAVSSQWSPVQSVTVVQGEATATVLKEVEAAQRRTPPEDAAADPSTVSPPSVGAATVSNTVAEARDRLESPLFNLSQSAASLDVSELSHITDEAQVYAELGRTNEAIDILADHIDRYDGDRPSPAPWLMLFELFRKTNRRADYDRLAPMFRKRFNGRLPEWEDYGQALALDDGLESFPHLIARIERDWGTPSARALLDELLYDNRGGSRLGFSLAAYKDLLLLLQLHDQLAADGRLGPAHTHESPGADDDDGTPKWDLSLESLDEKTESINPDLDEFLKPKK